MDRYICKYEDRGSHYLFYYIQTGDCCTYDVYIDGRFYSHGYSSGSIHDELTIDNAIAGREIILDSDMIDSCLTMLELTS